MTILLIAIAVLAIACALLWFKLRKSDALVHWWFETNSKNASRAEEFAARFRAVDIREASFRQALGYYADSDNWRGSGAAHSPAFKDRGKRAREALDPYAAVRKRGIANASAPSLLSASMGPRLEMVTKAELDARVSAANYEVNRVREVLDAKDGQ